MHNYIVSHRLDDMFDANLCLNNFEQEMYQLGYDISRHNVRGHLYYIDKQVQQYWNKYRVSWRD